jgi:hypothetical protein
MNDPIVIMLLRAFHIVSGVFWVGSIALLARFVVAASLARERDPGGVLGELFQKRRLGVALAGAGIVNFATGILLYSEFYIDQPWNLAAFGPAEAFGLGGMLAMTALVIGLGYGVSLHTALSRQPSVTSKDAALHGARLALLTRLQSILLVTATVLMAIGRYV